VYAVTLAVPKPQFEFLVFTDASGGHWAAVLVQHTHDQNALGVNERDLQPMTFAWIPLPDGP
jgi:hypothetical protein